MGHALQCKVQQNKIKIILDKSRGKTAVIIMDYMMKYEETRACESSCEHYSKRGIAVHGTLLKYVCEDGSKLKRIYVASPEEGGSQDEKVALVNLDIVSMALKL